MNDDTTVGRIGADHVAKVFAQTRHVASVAPKTKAGNVARVAHAMSCFAAGKFAEASAVYEEVARIDPAHFMAGINASFCQTMSDCGPEEMFRLRRALRGPLRFEGERKPHLNDRDPNRPLRVGYVSGDFKEHSAALIFSNVLLNHSEAVVPYFYNTLEVEDSDIRRPAFKAAAGDRWQEIEQINDAEADAMIRADGIDVLVDLSAYTFGSRLDLFARKPAPVQVTAWGHAHGVGMDEGIMDHFFADPVAVPPNERKWYSERIHDLPCIVTLNPKFLEATLGEDAPPAESPHARSGRFTFGNFSNAAKLSDACLKAMAEIVKRTPNSRLLLRDKGWNDPWAVEKARAASGLGPDRLEFRGKSSHREHLRAMRSCDLMLDSFPHGAGAVALECLWMGVPLLTLRGRNTAGRTAASVLTAMRCYGWVADAVNEFVARAVSMARDPAALAVNRKYLRRDLLESPVVRGYPQAVEKAYRTIWQECCAK